LLTVIRNLVPFGLFKMMPFMLFVISTSLAVDGVIYQLYAALKLLQSAEDKSPRLTDDEVGKLNVCVVPVLLIAKSVPAVPVAKVWDAVVKTFNDVIPELPPLPCTFIVFI